MSNKNIDKLISSVRDVDNVVLCVGAGLTVSSGLPNMSQLVEKLLQVLTTETRVDVPSSLTMPFRASQTSELC